MQYIILSCTNYIFHAYIILLCTNKYIPRQTLTTCTLKAVIQDLVDTRAENISTGIRGFLSRTTAPMRRPGRLKSGQIERIAKRSMAYIFKDILVLQESEDQRIELNPDPERPRQQAQLALDSLVSLCSDMLRWKSDYKSDTPGHRAKMDGLRAQRKVRAIEVVVNMETWWPKSEMTISVHQLIHLADAVDEWNHVRNYWAFFLERFNNEVKTKINSRSQPHENLAKVATRAGFLRGIPVEMRLELLRYGKHYHTIESIFAFRALKFPFHALKFRFHALNVLFHA